MQSKNNFARSQGQIKRREREKSSVNAKVEHVFGVVKGLFGYRKTRYKGRRKQDAKLQSLSQLGTEAAGRALRVPRPAISIDTGAERENSLRAEFILVTTAVSDLRKRYADSGQNKSANTCFL